MEEVRSGILFSLRNGYLALKDLDSQERSNPKIVLAALERRGNALCYAHDSLKYDEDFLYQAYQTNPKCWWHFPREIKDRHNQSVDVFLYSHSTAQYIKG